MPDAPELSAGYRVLATSPDYKCTRSRYTLFVFRHLAQKQNHRIRLQTADSIAQIGVLDAGFPVKELKLFGSARSAGTKVQTKWGEVVEHAASFNSLAMGETVGNVAKNVDIQSYRVPLGVCGGICPFNFPAMIPLWMFPMAVTLGNTYVMKPSEKVPGATNILMELLNETGMPPGVVNIV